MLQTVDHKPLKLAKFQPVLKMSNFEPDWLSFTYNGGTDLHLQVKLWKTQGRRWICTGLHLMCIAQAHSIGFLLYSAIGLA